MKNAAVFWFALLWGASASAQSVPAFSEDQMNQMLQQAQGIQSCIKQVDQKGFSALNEEGKQVQKDIIALCKAGDREQAQYEAVQFAEKVKKSVAYQAMSKCASPMVAGVAATLLQAAQSTDVAGNPKVHVCDHIQNIASHNH